VLIASENEALLSVRDLGTRKYQIVYPSVSILAEPPVAVVDRNVDKRGTRAAAEAYLKFLYTPAAQEIIARNYFRPRNGAVAAKYKGQFPNMKLFTIDRNFGGWNKAQALHFNDGGLFDQEYEAAKR
jgi:sulfate transport system substrate-binding protein